MQTWSFFVEFSPFGLYGTLHCAHWICGFRFVLLVCCDLLHLPCRRRIWEHQVCVWEAGPLLVAAARRPALSVGGKLWRALRTSSSRLPFPIP